jgi:hypothetical protein
MYSGGFATPAPQANTTAPKSNSKYFPFVRTFSIFLQLIDRMKQNYAAIDAAKVDQILEKLIQFNAKLAGEEVCIHE